MSSDINFLATGPVSHGKEKKLKQVRIIALVFILIVGLASVFTFVLNLASPIEGVRQEQNQILSQITSNQEKAAKLAIVNERVISISKIYSERPDYVQILDQVLSKKPNELRTSGLDIGESSIILSVSSSSLLPLNNFLNSVIDLSKTNDRIGSVFLDSLSASQNSSAYIMGVKIILKDE